MLVNGTFLNEEEIIGNDSKFLKKHGNIYISDEQLSVLKKYDIDINRYKDISELIYAIEEYINDSYDELDDLEWVSQTLSEYNYYNNTNK